MTEQAARDLAAFIARETSDLVMVQDDPMRLHSYWVVLEGRVPIQIVRSWIEWHRRKAEILERERVLH